MNEECIKIAFAGGGTGGHIYPALAIISALRQENGFDVFWIGQEAEMDRSIVEGAGVRFYGISAGKLRRYFSFRNISDVFRIFKGILEARAIFKRERPALLFSKGGFASVPPALAAKLLGIPAHTHESDVSPGLATRINAYFAACIWTAYEDTAGYFKHSLRSKVCCSGNPVRAFIRSGNAERGRAFIETASGQSLVSGEKILLVLGGSQGAKEINDLVRNALDGLTGTFFVVHQTGGSGTFYTAPRYLAIPYIKDEMADLLAASDLVMGRSGAGTVWESAAAGKPMVLVPLAGSGTRGDQVENAAFFVRAGAALSFVHPQAEEISAALTALAGNAARLSEMAAASKKIGERDAVSGIVNGIKSDLAAARKTAIKKTVSPGETHARAN